jgi:hypothetical protein
MWMTARKNIHVYDFAADAALSNGRIFGEEPGEKARRARWDQG